MGALGAAARGELGALAAAVVTAGWGARVGPRAWWGVAALGAVASAATALVRP
jgi:hypothetical protein